MINYKKIMTLVSVFFLVVVMAACGQKDAGESNKQEQVKPQISLTVSAAASLKAAMEDIRTAYAEEKPDVTLTYNFGSSGSLQQQIEQGAEVDVFLSAAVKQMNALQDKGLIIEDTRKDFLENKIVLVVPEGTSTITDFNDLATDKAKKIGLGEPNSVPVGQYAQEVLKNLGLLDSIKAGEKAVYGKDVKEVLTWVETGNVDAGIVYETDAKISDKVKVAAKAPDGSVSPVYYPAAVIKASKNVDAAKNFTEFIYSGKAKPVFEKYGFVFMAK